MAWSAQRRRRSGAIAGRRTGPRMLAAAACLLATMTPALADRALIVGIDQYDDPALTFKLPGASRADSERIHALLTGAMGYRDEDIKVLRDKEATRAAILESLEGWLGESKPGERVFFYYVGHGHYTKDLDGDEGDGLDETLVPYDAVVDRAGPSVVVKDMILDDDLAAAFDKLKGRHVTAVIDSCHSGTVTRSITGPAANVAARTPQLFGQTRSIRVDPTVVEQAQSGPAPDAATPDVDLVTWTAVAPTQLALIDEDAAPNYHGVFTAAFADGIEKGLADKSKNGVISNQELLDYVRERSADYCKRHAGRCEMGVTPSLDGDGAALKVAAANPVAKAVASIGGAPPAAEESAPPVAEGGPPAGEGGPPPVVEGSPPPVVEGTRPPVVEGGPPSVVEGTRPPVVEGDPPPVVEVKPGDPINAGKTTPAKVLDILGATVSTDVLLEQIPPSPVRLGTKNIRFRVTSPRDGYLVLLSVSDDGDVVQLFPNAFSDKHAKDGRIRAGHPVTFPDPSYGIRFDATSVTKGTVLALVAVDPLKLSKSFLTRKIDVIPQEEVNATVLPELAESLAKPANAEAVEANIKPVERSVATLPYEITP